MVQLVSKMWLFQRKYARSFFFDDKWRNLKAQYQVISGFTMLGTLIGGRIGIPRSALAAAKSGLTIAIKYSDQRRQFGPEGGLEVPILNYRIHQRRLLPLLAKTYAIHFALQYVTNRFITKKNLKCRRLKPLPQVWRPILLGAQRLFYRNVEAIGGKGYLSENRIDALKNTEIYTTFEGDNTVLMQLVAKIVFLRKSFGKMDAMGIINYIWKC
jgi:acyl-CoA oxidase